MTYLIRKKCTPCSGKIAPLKGERLVEMARELHDDWKIVDEHHLRREFVFGSFRQVLDFVTKVGELAELEGHHPNICMESGKAAIDLWTHRIDGLSENDFILAAKIDLIE